MFVKERLAKAFRVQPHEVWRRHGVDGFGWYIRPFGSSEFFAGRNGQLAVLRRQYVATDNALADDPTNQKLKARLERLSKRLEVADPPKRGW